MSTTSAMTVLIVVNQRDLAAVTKDILEAQGYNVFIAFSGIDGLAIINSTKIDVVILNKLLPGIDGLTLSQMIQDNPATAAIQIITLSP